MGSRLIHKAFVAHGLRKLITFLFLAALLLLVRGLALAEDNREIELRKRLFDQLEVFSKENGISMFDTVMLLKKEFTFTEDFGKGGIGLIANDVYVVTDSKDGNVIIRNGKRTKAGATESVSVVLMHGEDILFKSDIKPKSPKVDTVPVTTIVFTKSRIYVLDWNTMTGRYFRRR